MFNGLGMYLGNLSQLSNAESRSISPENFTGEKGKGGMATSGTGEKTARELGQGWKMSPSVLIKPNEEFVMANIEGEGAIQHIWMAGQFSRDIIFRIYWDYQEHPSVEVPIVDFFAVGWSDNTKHDSVFKDAPGFTPVNSLPISVNPNNGFSSYFEMPFRRRAKLTMENRSNDEKYLYYSIDYTLTEVPEHSAYFHAQFRRTKVVPYMEDYTIIDGIEGRGHYVGTVLNVGLNGAGKWWGEGELKVFMDGDKEFPTICGTGLEDYFGGAWNWDVNNKYTTYSTPFLGMHQVEQPDGLYRSQQRFGMYRWHVLDPIRFKEDLKITIQDLGWRSDGRYLPRQDDMSSVAYWYQTLPTTPFPKLGDRNDLEIV